MGQINTSVELPATPERVFELAGDPNHFEKWLTLHVKFKDDLPQQLSTGARFTEVISMMGMPNTITWTVDEFQPPKTLKISGTGLAGVRISLTLAVARAGGGRGLALAAGGAGRRVGGGR